MDGSVLAVLAVYQNYLVTSENDDVTSGCLGLQSQEKLTFAVKELRKVRNEAVALCLSVHLGEVSTRGRLKYSVCICLSDVHI